MKILRFCSIALLLAIPGGYSYEFDQDYIGVVFGPYGKAAVNGNYPPWNNYTFYDVEQLMEVASRRFRNISTYGMGVTQADATSWEEGDAVGFVGMAAAEVNRKYNKTLISAYLAIWGHVDLKVYTEMDLAFSVAQQANAIHLGTILGITLTSNYVVDFPSSKQLLALVKMARDKGVESQQHLKIGFRTDICQKIIDPKENVTFLTEVIENVDYIICYMMPPGWAARGSVQYAVDHMTDIFKQARTTMRKINSNILVTFETGWPSAGISKSSVPTSIAHLREYWETMGTWAVKNKFPLSMFEVVDNPWKVTFGTDRTSATGVCGADSHYGWWRRTSNEDESVNSYVEKTTEGQLPACDPEEGVNAQHLAIGLSIVVFVLVALVVTMYLKLRAAKHGSLSEKDIEEFEKGLILVDGENNGQFEIALSLPYDRKFELTKEKFNINRERVLGSGAFGIVYKGRIPEQNVDAAFKTTKPRTPTENLKNLLSEIKLMIYIGTHPNIVCLLGAYTGEIRQGGVYIASEYCANGSLESVLRKICDDKQGNYDNTISGQSQYTNANTERYVNAPSHVRPESTSMIDTSVNIFSMQNLLKWAHQIANGMTHLAVKQVVHADLATRNVLLTGDGTAKITDFGLSRKMYAYTEYVKQNQEPLPWRWMAMESLQRLAFSSESDCWSYAVTLWEIFSLGDVPYPGLAWDVGFLDQLKDGLRLQKPKYASTEIYSQMILCWNPEPKDRPTFHELTAFFKELALNSN